MGYILQRKQLFSDSSSLNVVNLFIRMIFKLIKEAGLCININERDVSFEKDLCLEILFILYFDQLPLCLA